jgi:diguanylate cyclase (GGDEF)-like protein
MILKDRIKKLELELRRYKQLSERDCLTGLYNRRKFERDIQRYIDLIERHRIRFSLMMIDINKFKEINDTKGHKTGDKVLVSVAHILHNTIRKSDRVYRLSGDEFVIIFSHHKSKRDLVNRIRKVLAEIKITVSIGYCDLKHKYCRDILEMIDRRMYEEKRKK